MYEPKLLARLDSIKHHLMSGMATPYVIDEIECLQRDIDEEMRATSRRSDYSRYKPTIEFQGDFVEIKDIRLTGVPIDHDYFRGSTDDLEPDLKPDETPLQFDSGRYDLHPKVAHWICQLKSPPPTWVTSLKVPKNPNFGDKPLKTFAGRDLSEAH